MCKMLKVALVLVAVYAVLLGGLFFAMRRGPETFSLTASDGPAEH